MPAGRTGPCERSCRSRPAVRSHRTTAARAARDSPSDATRRMFSRVPTRSAVADRRVAAGRDVLREALPNAVVFGYLRVANIRNLIIQVEPSMRQLVLTCCRPLRQIHIASACRRTGSRCRPSDCLLGPRVVVAERGAETSRGAASPLRVGAAKVDVTPIGSELPKNGFGILDHLYARAIVLDNGAAPAALITVDAGAISGSALASGDAADRKGARHSRRPHVLLTATHTHSVPAARAVPTTRRRSSRRSRLAKQQLTPARVGYGTGESYINVNRQIIDPKTGRWWEGPNREGPSDKTVAVLKFESLTGEPLAVYYNYAVHGVIAGQLDQVSGDIPGASVALHRGLLRRQRRRGLVDRRRRATRIRSTSSRRTTCATSASRTTRSAASTSATRCRPAARASTGTIPPSRG